MASYICKCGRVVKKSTTADNTGNRDTAGCEGCPYLLPWGPDKYVQGQGFIKDIQGYECRVSPTLEYRTELHGRLDDKTTIRVTSLDFDFLERVSNWVKEHYPNGELLGGFSRDRIRAVEYVDEGRYRYTLACSQNKKGIAAKRALWAEFFDETFRRKDMDADAEKQKILRDIEQGKAAAQRKEDEMQTDDHGIMTDAGELLENGTECRHHAVSRVRIGAGKIQAIHVCDDQPEGVKIWLNASCPAEYWVLSKAGEIEGEHIEGCPYCAALLKIGCGDVLLMPINKELESSKLPKIPDNPTSPACSCAGCKREDCTCAGGRDAAGRADCAGEQNCAQSGCSYAVKHRANPTPADADASPCAPGASDVPPSPSQSAAADVQQGGGDDTANPTYSAAAASSGPEEPVAGTAEPADLPEVCRGCQCATCGNPYCRTPCRQKSDEVEECEQLGPMGDDCEDYQPKEDAECLKKPAPNGDAGAATQSLCAAAPASLAADPAPKFDYSGMDIATVDTLRWAERAIRDARRKCIADVAEAVCIVHDQLVRSSDGHNLSDAEGVVRISDNSKHGNRGEQAFVNWCRFMGISKTTAYQLLQVHNLLSGATPEELRVLENSGTSLLYVASRPSAEPEAVEALKREKVKTLKEFRALEAQIKAEREAREQAEQQLADAQREHQAERESTSAMLREEQQRRQKAEEGRIAAEKDKAAAQQRAAKAEAQGKKDAALVEKLQDIVLQRDNEVAEQKERADAAEIRAQQAENRPVEVAVQAPDPAEVQRLASEKAAEMTAMLKAQLHTLQTQLDDAESRADAAANNAYMSAAEFAAQAAAMIDGIRASFWAMAKELPDTDFNQALEPLDRAVSRIFNREWEDGWDDSWENEEDTEL